MQRIFLIDLLRCIAMAAMLIFHTVYDLAVFYDYPLDYEQGFWRFVQVVFAGGLFIFVSGWTATLGRRSVRNLVYLGLAALLVSAVTYYQFGNAYVRFGILHFLFVVNLLYRWFLCRLSVRQLLLLILLIAACTQFVAQLTTTDAYFVWLDILPLGYQSVDHYPLLPWMAVFSAGVLWGRLALSATVARFNPQGAGRNFVVRCSKESLLIYILHQPLILVILHLFFACI